MRRVEPDVPSRSLMVRRLIERAEVVPGRVASVWLQSVTRLNFSRNGRKGRLGPGADPATRT
jgi:hypothetical protein